MGGGILNFSIPAVDDHVEIKDGLRLPKCCQLVPYR
jgi:hypothetical protein